MTLENTSRAYGQNRKPVAWITGAGTGIGRAGAIALAQAGYSVALSGRQVGPLETVARHIVSMNGSATVVPLDVVDAQAVDSAAKAIEMSLGSVDVLVNSAGVNIPRRGWSDLQVDGWRHLVDVNLTGTFLCMHAVLPSMRANRSGLVVNISSWAGRHPAAVVGPGYNATKHAVVALTHSFNMEECSNGLRACVILPGETDTPILQNRPNPVPEIERTRMLQEDDLGRTIAFVAGMPPRVCINEILISPTHNRAFISQAAPPSGPQGSQ